MNRRSLLRYSGFSAIAIAMGAGGYLSFFRKKDVRLAISLKPLFDPSFKEVAKIAEPDLLFTTLKNKGVVDINGEFNISKVKELAKTDQVVGYKGRYYSQTELELYSLAYLIHEGDLK